MERKPTLVALFALCAVALAPMLAHGVEEKPVITERAISRSLATTSFQVRIEVAGISPHIVPLTIAPLTSEMDVIEYQDGRDGTMMSTRPGREKPPTLVISVPFVSQTFDQLEQWRVQTAQGQLQKKNIAISWVSNSDGQVSKQMTAYNCWIKRRTIDPIPAVATFEFAVERMALE